MMAAEKRSWARQEIDKVRQLRLDGKTYREIAETVGATCGQVTACVAYYAENMTVRANNTWRAKQLITAGYTTREISEFINIPIEHAQAALDQVVEAV